MSFQLDHLIIACPDLDEGIQWCKNLLGVEAVYGGQHSGLGTHNAIIPLDKKSYLEIIAPDPAQADITGPLWLGADQYNTLPLVVGQPSIRDWRIF